MGGFIEFDEVNGGILTLSNTSSTFSYWSMKTLKKVFEVDDSAYQETRLSAGTVTFFKKPVYDALPILMIQAIDGKTICSTNLPTETSRELQFLEVCGVHVLLKQAGRDIEIFDTARETKIEVPLTSKFAPLAVSFFPSSHSKSSSTRRVNFGLVASFVDRIEIWTMSQGKFTLKQTLNNTPISFDGDTCVYSDHTNQLISAIESKPTFEKASKLLYECNDFGLSESSSPKEVDIFDDLDLIQGSSTPTPCPRRSIKFEKRLTYAPFVPRNFMEIDISVVSVGSNNFRTFSLPLARDCDSLYILNDGTYQGCQWIPQGVMVIGCYGGLMRIIGSKVQLQKELEIKRPKRRREENIQDKVRMKQIKM